LDDLQACNDLMLKQGSGLQRALADLEMIEPPSPELAAKFKIVSERATLFRIAANAMINVSPNDNLCEIERHKISAYDTFLFLVHLFSKFCSSDTIVRFENLSFLEFLFFLRMFNGGS